VKSPRRAEVVDISTRLNVALEPSREEIVDEFSKLDGQLQPIKPLLKRHDELRKKIQGWYDNEPAEQAFTVNGENGNVVSVSARSHETKIVAMSKLFTSLGKARFIALVHMPLKNLYSAFSRDAAADYVETERTGSRTVRAVAVDTKIAA